MADVARAQARLGPLFLLNADFVLIGMGTTVLGPSLPALSARWGMNDAHAGALFLAQFLGSSVGAVLAALHPFRSVLTGFVIVALGMATLALASAGAAFSVFFFYGVGLGLVLTGTNLAGSNLAGARRGVVLSWLNFSWSVGATLCPVLVAVFLRSQLLRSFLLLLAASFACMALLLLAQAREHIFVRYTPASPENAAGEAAQTGHSLPFLMAFFGVMLFLYVGVESTIGGWLSTLAVRATHSARMGALAVSASALFWLALLVGRGVSSLLLHKVRETVLHPAAAGLAMVSVCLLLDAHSFAAIGAAGALAGFVLSPIYALSTSFYLSRTKASRASGLVFAFSGLGGAALPWATGAISAHQHSLYWGLVVPLAGTVFLFAQSLYSVFRLAPALAVQAVADENATPLLGP